MLTYQNTQKNPLANFLYQARRFGKNQIRYKEDLLRQYVQTYVFDSAEYKAHILWANRLKLSGVQYDVRPSIIEMFFYQDIATEHALASLLKHRQQLNLDARRQATKETPFIMLTYPEEFSINFVSKLGQLLGYPDCCNQAYVKDRQAGVNVELRAAKQLEKMQPDGNWSYFVKDFFPCSPDCVAARHMGKEAFEKLNAIDVRLGQVYLKLLTTNRRRIENNPVYLNQYSQKLLH